MCDDCQKWRIVHKGWVTAEDASTRDGTVIGAENGDAWEEWAELESTEHWTCQMHPDPKMRVNRPEMAVGLLWNRRWSAVELLSDGWPGLQFTRGRHSVGV